MADMLDSAIAHRLRELAARKERLQRTIHAIQKEERQLETAQLNANTPEDRAAAMARLLQTDVDE